MGGQQATRPLAFTLPTGERALRERIESLRRLIANGNSDQRALRSRAAELYDMLLRPADEILASSDRLAISPDGPLHVLPFGALIRSDGGVDAGRWLAEWRPIYVVASATHHAELKRARSRRVAREDRLVAFGDPSAARTTRVTPPELLRDTAHFDGERGFALSPLPSARHEVRAIERLFGENARTYLGAEATETRAKAIGEDVSYLHFACHAVLNEKLPLNSALVLAIPETVVGGEDNGLLQVWEIFDEIRLDAELVTLSGCDTAVGGAMGGEGLMSLTRAFLYAGARSVLASLWQVQDVSTADLMVRFYTHLKDGRSKVDALRLAQIDLIRKDPKGAHPFRWAPFVLFGDWR